MPLYFFDVDDGAHRFDDRSGIVLNKLADVADEAESLLRLLGYQQVNNLETGILKTTVRDQLGDIIYHGTITTGKGPMMFFGRKP